MTAGEPTVGPRPMLVNGEALGVRIERSYGGGEPFEPQSYEQARAIVGQQLEEAIGTLAALPTELRGPRLFLEAKVLPNFLATGHFPTALLDEAGLIPVGARASRGLYVTERSQEEDAPSKTILLSAEDESLPRFAAAIAEGRTETLRDQIATLERIAAPAPGRVTEDIGREPIVVDGLLAMEAVLHPAVDSSGDLDVEAQQITLQRWVAWVEHLGGTVELDWVRPQAGMLFTPVLVPPDQVSQAGAFNPLRAMRAASRIRPIPQGPLRSLGGVRPDPPTGAPSTAEVIAIFDGEPAPNIPALAPYMAVTDLTGGAPNIGPAVAHASTVASAALFGNIDQSVGLAQPPAAIEVFRVWPPPESDRPDLDLIWVLDQIVRQVSSSSYRIVNLSVGPEINVEDDGEPHIWSTTLDQLAAGTGTLFCVAAGNSGEEGAGLDRVQVPADMANGLSIGASDTGAPDPWTRAPYSCVGPGRPGTSVCPLVVGEGGHLDSSTPFVCLLPGGQYGESDGTSLAAPVVARSLAEASAALGPRSSANVLRALAVHSAEAHDELSTAEVGYGRMPASILGLLDCEPNEATILYEGSLQRGKTISFAVPLPTDLLEECGGARIPFRWTLVFKTAVSPTDAVDYGEAGVEVFFRPNSQRFNMNLQGKSPIAVDLRKEEDRTFRDFLIGEGRTPSDRPITRGKNEYAPETERRADGKWETVIRVDDRMRASGMHQPVLDMHLLTRRDGGLTAADADEDLDYALLMTVVVPAGVSLYDRVRLEAPVLQPLAVTLPVTLEQG